FFGFSPTNPNPYYLNTETFTTLVTNRKDLCVVALVNSDETAFTINSVSDARLFLQNQSLNAKFTWTNNPLNTYGNFKSIQSLQTWVQSFGATKSLISIVGTI